MAKHEVNDRHLDLGSPTLQRTITRKIIAVTLLPVALAYIGRILIHQSLEYDRGPFGSLWWFICPIVCILGLGIGAFVIWISIISVRYVHHIAPALVLLGGIALVPFLPLPPLPLPVFPEEEFFLAHRGEFEQVINMARQNKLNCLTDLGCDVLARQLPPNYDILSNTGFVQVANYPPSSLSVKFWPLDSYYPIVYFEVPEDRNLFWNSECLDSRWTRKLDEHWYLCVEDWL